jgi:hypothetical protein
MNLTGRAGRCRALGRFVRRDHGQGQPGARVGSCRGDSAARLHRVANRAERRAEAGGAGVDVLHDGHQAPEARRSRGDVRAGHDLEDHVAQAQEGLAHAARLADAPDLQARRLQGRVGALEVRGEDDDMVERDGGVRVRRRGLALGARRDLGRQAIEVGARHAAERPAQDPLAGGGARQAQADRADLAGAILRDLEAEGAPALGVGGDRQLVDCGRGDDARQATRPGAR